MRTPRIGVPGMWSNQVHGLRFDALAVASAVLEGIVRAGGEPVPMFALTAMDENERYGFLDGLVLPGGADIDPARYGRTADEHTSPADYPVQDDADAGAIRACLERNIPALLICRGMQLLNTEFGGTLHLHAPSEPINHVGSIHPVTPEPGSLLADVWDGGIRQVSSYHHQTVDEVGAGLTVTGHAPDGTVESLEIPGKPLLAVQWHPEDRAATDPTDAQLFEWIVDQARQRVNNEHARLQRFEVTLG